jgi:bacterioferritin
MTEFVYPEQNNFLKDVSALYERARGYLSDDTDQGNARGKAGRSVKLLQTVLSTEIICVLRYTKISVSEIGLKDAQIGAEFQEQANDERRHMAAAAVRIKQLGGVPDFSLKDFATPNVGHIEGKTLSEIVRNNLCAEQVVIRHYRELIEHFSAHDPLTQRILEDTLEEEENHTADMQDMLLNSE